MKYLVAVSILLSVSGSLFAEEPKAASEVSAYLEQLQVKLEHTARRVNQPTSSGSSVVGLRGSKQESSATTLYWKGKTTAEPVSTDEVKLFRSAVEQARAGQKTQAVAALQSFKEKYPKSALMPDVDETLKRLL